MAKAKPVKMQKPTGKVCVYCGDKSCHCMKYAGVFYIVLGIVFAAFALGYLSLVTSAWVVALLFILKGLAFFTGHM